MQYEFRQDPRPHSRSVVLVFFLKKKERPLELEGVLYKKSLRPLLGGGSERLQTIW